MSMQWHGAGIPPDETASSVKRSVHGLGRRTSCPHRVIVAGMVAGTWLEPETFQPLPLTVRLQHLTVRLQHLTVR